MAGDLSGKREGLFPICQLPIKKAGANPLERASDIRTLQADLDQVAPIHRGPTTPIFRPPTQHASTHGDSGARVERLNLLLRERAQNPVHGASSPGPCERRERSLRRETKSRDPCGLFTAY